MAKKQKVAANSSNEAEKGPADEEAEFEGFSEKKSHDGKAVAAPSQNIGEGWEEVSKDGGSAVIEFESESESESEFMPLDEEPVLVEGRKERMAKTQEADEGVANPTASLPNMLTKDW